MQNFLEEISYFWAQAIFFTLILLIGLIVLAAIWQFKRMGLSKPAILIGYWLLAAALAAPLFLYVETWANNKLCPKGTHYSPTNKTHYICAIDSP